MTSRRDREQPPEADPAPPSGADVAFIAGPSSDGLGLGIVRLRENRIEKGELREARDGQPIVGELVKLTPRQEHDRLFDVEVLAKTTPAATRSLSQKTHGPAKVSSDAFRDGWEAIFGDARDRTLN